MKIYGAFLLIAALLLPEWMSATALNSIQTAQSSSGVNTNLLRLGVPSRRVAGGTR